MPPSRTILAHNLILRSSSLFLSLYPNLIPKTSFLLRKVSLHLRRCYFSEYVPIVVSTRLQLCLDMERWQGGSAPSVLIYCLFWGAFSRLDLENIQSLWGGRKKIPSSCLVSVHGA